MRGHPIGWDRGWLLASLDLDRWWLLSLMIWFVVRSWLLVVGSELGPWFCVIGLRSRATARSGVILSLTAGRPSARMPLVARFRIDVDVKLSRRQRRRLQQAAFRWRMQIDPKRTEAPWRRDWGVQYECEAGSEAEARGRVAGALGEDLGDVLIVTRRPSD